MGQHRYITPRAEALILALDPSDRATYRQLFDHILAAASEGLCPLCSRTLSRTPSREGTPWCPACIMVWDLQAWPEHVARMLTWDDELLGWWSAAWKTTFTVRL